MDSNGVSLASSSGFDAAMLTGGSPSYEARVQRFKAELQNNSISMDNLRMLAFHGIPDRDGLRAVTWKVNVLFACLTACVAQLDA